MAGGGWVGRIQEITPEDAAIRKSQTQESGDSHSAKEQEDQSLGSRGEKDPGGDLEAEEIGAR